MSASLSASTARGPPSGIFSKAAFTGTKIVNGPSLFNVSTSPASVTAVTSVDSSGLLLVAVAAGSSVIPAKVPSPSVGTARRRGRSAPSPCPCRLPIGSVVIGSVIGPVVTGSAAPGASLAAGASAVSSSPPQAAASRERDATAAMTPVALAGMSSWGGSFRGFT